MNPMKDGSVTATITGTGLIVVKSDGNKYLVHYLKCTDVLDTCRKQFRLCAVAQGSKVRFRRTVK